MNREELQSYYQLTFTNNKEQKISGTTVRDGYQNLLQAIYTQDEISTIQQSYVSKLEKGNPQGVASLDDNAKILLSQIPDISGNGKISVSGNDITQNYLNTKLQAGSNILINLINPGDDEYLLISATSGGSNNSVWGSITGNISAQDDLYNLLNAKVNINQIGQANGVASLGIDGIIPLTQIPSSLIGGLILQGAWNALTNTPYLSSGNGTKGYLYVVTVGNNNINLDSVTSVKSGDSVFFDGNAWQKITGQSVSVSSVFGRIGDINGQTGDYNADQISETTRKFVNSEQINKINNTPSNTVSELSNKVDKVVGMGLSSNDFTSALKSNYDAAYNEKHQHTNKTTLDLVSGTNTGDETAITIKNKLGITILSGVNTGDQDLSSFATIVNLSSHTYNYNNPHNVSKLQLNLENVDNTSDLNKPISTSVSNALSLKANQTTTYTKTEVDNAINVALQGQATFSAIFAYQNFI